eukprot:SAG22_NODE_1504_length_4277_cov_4.550503_1_plen_78_part_10
MVGPPRRVPRVGPVAVARVRARLPAEPGRSRRGQQVAERLSAGEEAGRPGARVGVTDPDLALVGKLADRGGLAGGGGW